MNKRNDEENACLVIQCENCGKLHVYKKEEKKMEKHAHIAVVDRCG